MNTPETPPELTPSHADRLRVITASYAGDEHTVRDALRHADGEVRASALTGLHRLSALDASVLHDFATDESPYVRRIVAQLSSGYSDVDITALLNDTDMFVAEMTAWALGEREQVTESELDALIQASESSPEAIVREAATAALGAIGDERGLAAILRACSDKPAIRRRAVLALAPFEGDLVDQALRNALNDNDWQVRQNAEDMLRPRDGSALSDDFAADMSSNTADDD